LEEQSLEDEMCGRGYTITDLGLSARGFDALIALIFRDPPLTRPELLAESARLAFSYIGFSTPQQKLGDSLRLDDTATLLRDMTPLV
jgi:hypothetical protein